ncbi:hypothetical protein [Robiginitalea sp. IMCC43444]|uniref:hypothetical protein n=1 Tax=Robiginitalea sp. IMCC43444 TaxID=3459121 RepID=UPI0040428AB7
MKRVHWRYKILILLSTLIAIYIGIKHLDTQKNRREWSTATDGLYLQPRWGYLSNYESLMLKLRTLRWKLYYPKSLFKKKSPEFNFLLSANDKKIVDSVVFLGIKRGIFTKDSKKYRNAELIYKDSLFKIKFKLRGSHPYPYIMGDYSVKVKSKEKINGLKTFNIIAGSEMDYKTIYANKTGRKYGVYTQDQGEIVSYRFNGVLRDGFLYPEFDAEYVLKEFGDTLHFIYKNHKNWLTHTSPFDNLYYNVEDRMNFEIKDNIGFHKWRTLKNFNFTPNEFEIDYLGRYLALIYLFGNGHQITGDNLEWLNVNNNLVPLFRNENGVNALTVFKSAFDEVIFSHHPGAPSYDLFRQLLTNDSIRTKRNRIFKKMISEKEELISDFDQLFLSNYEKHLTYNDEFFLQDLWQKTFKKNLDFNIEKFKEYLKTGLSFVIHENDTLRITSETYVDLKVLINNKHEFNINPVEYGLDNEKLRTKFTENLIPFAEKILSLELINEYVNDTTNINLIHEVY